MRGLLGGAPLRSRKFFIVVLTMQVDSIKAELKLSTWSSSNSAGGKSQVMNLLVAIVLCAFIASSSSGPANGTGRDKSKKVKLSDKDHYSDDGEHNGEYDHEAFLGKEEAMTFSDLSPQEARRRLEIIVDKMNTNKDGEVSEEELTKWIREVSRRFAYDDRDRHWDYHVKDGKTHINWEEYVEKSYGMIEDRNRIYDHGRNLTYNEIIARYEKRFRLADVDKNNLLDRDEFADFLHPHDIPWMQSIVVEEAFLDMDKDRDGIVTLEDYLNDLRFSYNKDDVEWREKETNNFHTHRDKNGDGKMDLDEVEGWFFPINTNPFLNEAKHLIHHADTNKDHVLSKEEILSQQDLFVGSHATEHGKFFVRHDEF